MTSLTTPPTSLVVSELEQYVFVCPATNDGVEGEWNFAEALRCEEIQYRTGPTGGHATFTYVPVPGDEDGKSVEVALSDYSIDDQVQVMVVGDDGARAVVFEGVISRPRFELQASDLGEGERVTFIAYAFPLLDNQMTEHQVRGRWMFEGVAGYYINESLSMPVTFNHRGRPNADSTNKIKTHDEALEAWHFTHDDDPAGVYWTLREAIKAVLAIHLFGPDNQVLNRFTTLEAATECLLASAVGDTGLDRQVPEVCIHGMGVFDAIKALCDACAYDMAIEPSPRDDDLELVGVDRSYQLRIWQRNTGTEVTFNLAKRGTDFSSATPENIHKKNNTNVISGMFDGSEIRNEIFASARTFIESTFELLPLWSPDDVDSASITAELQSATEDQLDGSGYHAKHVAGGVLYATYGHVGRRWGLDCIGGFDGYTDDPPATEDYAQPSAGYDFVNELDLDESEGADNAIGIERRQRGVTETIQWSKRVRNALPIRTQAARAKGIKYILEVTENGGTTWAYCPVKIATLTDNFGIMLNEKNLAKVNAASLGTGDIPSDPEKSWWGLIATGDLQFRLTCCIEADHAARANAMRQTTSRSVYKRGRVMVRTDVDEAWVAPISYYNEGENWIKVQAIGSHTHTGLTDLAQAARALLEDAAVSVTAIAPVIILDQYHLGDVVTKIQGRELSLAANTGKAIYYPNIVAITLDLRSGRQQMRIQTADMRLTGGN